MKISNFTLVFFLSFSFSLKLYSQSDEVQDKYYRITKAAKDFEIDLNAFPPSPSKTTARAISDSASSLYVAVNSLLSTLEYESNKSANSAELRKAYQDFRSKIQLIDLDKLVDLADLLVDANCFTNVKLCNFVFRHKDVIREYNKTYINGINNAQQAYSVVKREFENDRLDRMSREMNNNLRQTEQKKIEEAKRLEYEKQSKEKEAKIAYEKQKQRDELEKVDKKRWDEAKKTHTKQAYENFLKNGEIKFYIEKAEKIVKYWDKRVVYVYDDKPLSELELQELIGMNSNEKIYQLSEEEFNNDYMYFYNIKELCYSGKLKNSPKNLSQNDSLIYLEVRGKHEQLPEFVRNLNNLQTLKISGVQNLESLSDHLKYFYKLKELEINYFGTKNQKSIKGMIPTLKNLTIVFNSLNNIPDISNLYQNLESLSLIGSLTTYEIDLSSFLWNNNKIKSLKIDFPYIFHKLNQNTINAIGSLNSLKELTLNIPTVADLKPIYNLPMLTDLAINISGYENLSAIYNFKEIRFLELLHATPKLKISNEITQMQKLNCLSFSHEYIDDIDYKFPKEITQMKQLECVYIPWNNPRWPKTKRSKSLQKFLNQWKTLNKDVKIFMYKDDFQKYCLEKFSLD